jgi:hypothetical protein
MRPDRYSCPSVLWRLYRKKGQDGYQTRPQAAAALARKLAEANPERTSWLVGDSAYVNAALLQGRPKDLQVIEPLHWKAALHDRPAPRQPKQDDFQRWQRTAPGRHSADDERAIRALAADPPAVWRSATTTPAERQRISRLLIEHVCVAVDKTGERVDVELHWAGGLVASHTLSRPVKRSDLQADDPRLVERLRASCVEELTAAEIASRLNAEGFRPPKRAERFTRARVQRLLWHLDLDRREPHGSLAGLGRDEYRPGSLARRPGISRDTVRRWLRAGWLTTRRDADGHHVIWADASELRRLRELHRLPRTWATKDRRAELMQPKPRPER